MEQREQFVMEALQADTTVRSLCRSYGISPATAYKWLRRYEADGLGGLGDRSRRPQSSPAATRADTVSAVLAIRTAHPTWGARKIIAVLRRNGTAPPAASTITRLLHRHGLIDPDEALKHQPWKRFEHEHPNDLWQMDFKGDVPMGAHRCYPLTVLDDHSRFNLGLVACDNQRTLTVRAALTAIFRAYGLPQRMTMDNGSPWGGEHWKEQPYTALTVWLLRLGVGVSHSRPYHPQTQGKDERFHRTLNAELLRRHIVSDLVQAQELFDHWRTIYNTERPHEALAMQVPAQRYQPSVRAFPEHLPPIEYPDGAQVRSVQLDGTFSVAGRTGTVSKAFAGWKIALIPTETDGVVDAYFCQTKIETITINELPRAR